MENQSSAHVLFEPQTPVSLTDSYKTVDNVIPFPRQLNVELQKVFQFTTVLQEVEKKTWSSPKFCSESSLLLLLLLPHHFDDLVSSIKTEYGRTERRRNQIIDEVKIFTIQAELIQRQRRSPLLFAMGAATAITLETLLGKTGCRLLSVFGLCRSSKPKMEQLEGTTQPWVVNSSP